MPVLDRLSWPRVAALSLALCGSACGDNRMPALGDAGLDGAPLSDGGLADAAPAHDASPGPDAVPGVSCQSPVDLGAGGLHLGQTTGALASWSSSCSSGTAQAPDRHYRLEVGSTPMDVVARVLVDEDAANAFDAVLSARDECDAPETELACADFSYSEHIEILATTSTVYLAVDGTSQFGGESSGQYSLEARLRAIAGAEEACDPEGVVSRCGSGLRCSAGVCVTDSAAALCSEAAILPAGETRSGETFAFLADHFQGSCAFDASAGAGEAVFVIDLAVTSDLVIRTDYPETEFDTVLYLLDGCSGNELACADDIDAVAGELRSLLTINSLAAGSYLLVVDGASAEAKAGRLRVSLDAQPTP